MSQIYNDGTYLENNPSWHEEDSPWKATQIRKIIERNSLHPDKICEIGCGAGEVLKELSTFYSDGVNFSGYEISQQAYELCKKKEKPNLNFRLADLLEEETEYYDIAMAIDVFEHVSVIIKNRKKLGHIHYFTKDTAIESLKDTGHEIIDYFYTCGRSELPNKGWKSNLLKIPRKLLFAVNKDLAARLLGGYSLMVLAK